jgi:hypothetical protein
MKKSISILLCYCILALSTGCQTTRLLSIDEASAMNADKKYIVLHTPQSTYKLVNYKFTDDSVEGDLMNFSGKNAYAINIYIALLLEVKLDVNELKYIKLQKSVIQRITYTKDSPGKTVISVLGIMGVIWIIANNMTFNVGL